MSNFLIQPFLLLFILMSYTSSAQPTTTKIPVTDNYFGMVVTDDYRWMEKPNNSAFSKWLTEQDAYTEKIFSEIKGREKLMEKYNALDTLWSDFVFAVKKDGDNYLYLKRFRKEEKTCLIRRKGEKGKEEIIIDFKKEFPDKDFDYFPFEYSPISKYGAFHIRESKHEASTIYFYDFENKKFFPEQVRYSFGGYPFRTKFTHDGNGFFYYSLAVENNKSSTKNSRGMLHIIGTPPGKDRVMASRIHNPELADFNENSEFEIMADPDYKYILAYGYKDDGEYTLIADYSQLKKNKISWTVLTKPSDKLDKPIIRNGIAYFISRATPKQMVIKCRLGNLKNLQFETFIPEQSDKVDNLSATKDFLLIRYTNGVTNWFKQYDVRKARLENSSIKGLGIIRTERISEYGNEILMNVSTWSQPTTTFLYNPTTKYFKPFTISSKIEYPGVEDFIIKEVEVPAQDGEMIPLSIIYHKNTKLDGSAICHLSGYGAYGSISSPSFSVERYIHGKRGVIFVIAHVRGGGIKGEAWRLAGFKATKSNTWKDFILCAEWLVANKYTTSNKLIAEGASAGGIMVGRAMAERPDLFAVVISRVGVNNVLRHEIHSTGNIGEFGTIKDSLESRYLYNMDVVQHVKDGVRYPAVLATMGMTDGRVSPWQPAKFVAALQHVSASVKPVLLQVYYQGGHFGESGKARNTNIVNEWAFALWQTGHPDFKKISD